MFLNFVAIGMRGNWDQAVQTCYHLQSVEQLEEAWLAHLRATRKGAPIQLAQNTQPAARPAAELANREMVRRTAPPGQPQLDPTPVMRGQSDDEGWGQSPARPAGRPAYLPDALPVAVPSVPPPVPLPPVTLPPVQLGPPQFGPGGPR